MQSEIELSVNVDGEDITKTPVDCRVISDAIKINHGKDPAVENRRSAPGREKFVTSSLPSGKELEKARNKRIPFFTYAPHIDDLKENNIHYILGVKLKGYKYLFQHVAIASEAGETTEFVIIDKD